VDLNLPFFLGHYYMIGAGSNIYRKGILDGNKKGRFNDSNVSESSFLK
jgi:hypothetical protein